MCKAFFFCTRAIKNSLHTGLSKPPENQRIMVLPCQNCQKFSKYRGKICPEFPSAYLSPKQWYQLKGRVSGPFDFRLPLHFKSTLPKYLLLKTTFFCIFVAKITKLSFPLDLKYKSPRLPAVCELAIVVQTSYISKQ